MAAPKKVENNAIEGEVIKKEFSTMSTPEYAEYSKKNGRVMGRPKDEKTVLTTQELRVLINSNWTAEEIKEKHGIDDKELQQVVWALSREERREKPIKFGKAV